MPSSTSEIRQNSSVTIRCSISGMLVTGLSFNRQFDAQMVTFLRMKEGKIVKNTHGDKFMGRIEAREESRGGSDVDITLTLSHLQVDDTDLYYCHWSCFNGHLKSFFSNGSIIIVKEYILERVQPKCKVDILDILSIALNVIAIPFVLCLLILSVFALCKRFTKKFTPGSSAVRPPPRRPLPPCPPPQYQAYSYLSTSVSSTYSQEYLH